MARLKPLAKAKTSSEAQASTVAAILSVALLLAPALWNGFPFIYPDTGGYLLRPLNGTLELGRSALYGAFLIAGVPFSFWPNLLLQASLIVWLISLTLRVNALPHRRWLALGITAVLALTTSLPWFASLLMPDIFFPAGVMALYLLVYNADRLRAAERIALCIVIALAIASHMAMLALALGLVAAFWLIAHIRLEAAPSPRLGLAAFAVAGGLFLSPISNATITGEFAFTPGGVSFLFGRLVEDGIVTRYLDRVCPDASLRICAYRDQISQGYDDWLWKNDTPFWKLGGWRGYSGEERRIILATLASDPLAHLTTAIENSVEQFTSFITEVATDADDNSNTTDTFRDRLPQLYPALMGAPQQTGRLDVSPLNSIDVPIGWLSMAGLLLALIFRRRLSLSPRLVAFAATILLALAINAIVCGVFSHPADRYQSRLIPLAPLALVVILSSRKRAAA